MSNLHRTMIGAAASFALMALMSSCEEKVDPPTPDKPGPETETDVFEGIELSKLVDAGYRTDNVASAGNYEVVIGNCTEVMWEGDIIVFLDLYNQADADPLNPVLPSGTYLPGSECEEFTYGATSSYVQMMNSDGEPVYSPMLGEVKVGREGATYTVTVTGILAMGSEEEVSFRYVGPIMFTQRGTAHYEPFDKPQNVTFEHSQGRYWGGWFYPFADDLSLELFSGEFDENGSQTKGYYLHLGNVYMPKYADYNDTYVPLAEGVYEVRLPEESYVRTFAQPYKFEQGSTEDMYGSLVNTGVFVTYIDKEQNINKIGLIKDGTFTVSGTGDNVTLEFDFVTEEGISITGTYDGNLNMVNYNDNDQNPTWTSRPWTSMEQDHVYAFQENAVCDAFLLGDYIRPGKDTWMIMIASYDANRTGYGDYFTTELLVTEGNGTEFPTGTFEVTWEDKSGVMLPGFIDYGGTVLFTYYGDLTLDSEGYSTHSAPIASGTVTISREGDNYRFVFDMLDDGGNRITGEWTGPVNAEDLRDAMKGEEDGGHAHLPQLRSQMVRR